MRNKEVLSSGPWSIGKLESDVTKRNVDEFKDSERKEGSNFDRNGRKAGNMAELGGNISLEILQIASSF